MLRSTQSYENRTYSQGQSSGEGELNDAQIAHAT